MSIAAHLYATQLRGKATLDLKLARRGQAHKVRLTQGQPRILNPSQSSRPRAYRSLLCRRRRQPHHSLTTGCRGLTALTPAIRLRPAHSARPPLRLSTLSPRPSSPSPTQSTVSFLHRVPPAGQPGPATWSPGGLACQGHEPRPSDGHIQAVTVTTPPRSPALHCRRGWASRARWRGSQSARPPAGRVSVPVSDSRSPLATPVTASLALQVTH